MVTGEVFDGGVDYQLIACGRPVAVRCEPPLGFIVGERDRAGEFAVRPGYPKHSLQQSVIHGRREIDDQRPDRTSHRLGDAPMSGIRRRAQSRTATVGLPEALDHWDSLRIRPLAIDDQCIAFPLRDWWADVHIGSEPALDSPRIKR